ncbi:MAG: hypothetical protein MUC61_00845, partial [Amoebophilaceae bacterium]|nr:hypothetical protein [Amoebophilaceae bacterium]
VAKSTIALPSASAVLFVLLFIDCVFYCCLLKTTYSSKSLSSKRRKAIGSSNKIQRCRRNFMEDRNGCVVLLNGMCYPSSVGM